MEEEVDGPLRVLLNELAASQLDVSRAQPCVPGRIPSPPAPPAPPEPEPPLPSRLNLVDWATSGPLDATRAAVAALLPDLPLRASLLVRHLAPNGTVTLRVRCVRFSSSANSFPISSPAAARWCQGSVCLGSVQCESRRLRSHVRISSVAMNVCVCVCACCRQPSTAPLHSSARSTVPTPTPGLPPLPPVGYAFANAWVQGTVDMQTVTLAGLDQLLELDLMRPVDRYELRLWSVQVFHLS